MNFSNFLDQIKNIIPAITTAVALTIGLFSFDNILPYSMNFKLFGSIVIILALITTFYFRKFIVKYFKYVLFGTMFLLILFIILDHLLVVRIRYNDDFSLRILVGIGTNPSYEGMSDIEIIQDVGIDYLDKVYKNYKTVFLSYFLLFLMLIFSLIFCLGGVLKVRPKDLD